jgi:protein SCO1/2
VSRVPPPRVLALGAAGLFVLAALVLFLVWRPALRHEPVVYSGTPIVPPKAAADGVLVDGNGRPAHVLVPGFATTFLFFGYTHCPDECPLALASLGRAYRKLTPQEAARTRVVFVSVDPHRDTPAVVKRYIASFDPHFIALTGTRAALAPVWDAYGVSVDPHTHDIDHGDAIYAIDASNHVVLIYPPSASAADLAGDAEKLAS